MSLITTRDGASVPTIPSWQARLEAESPPVSLRRLVIASVAVIAIGFGGFFGWAMTARLDSAVPAMGSIVVESKRKSLSIIDPGLLAELKVTEGERVAAGQVLMRLDDTQARAQLGSLEAQHWSAIARIARLRAEQAGEHALSFPAELETARDDPRVAALLDNERRVMTDRWTAFESSQAVQRNKIGQLNDQIAALQAQASATRERLSVTSRELAGISELVAKGYATRTRLFELQRHMAELRGNIGELDARVAEARQTIGQTELEIETAAGQRQQDVSKELQEAQAQEADLAQRRRAAADLLEKRTLTAPEAGTVTNIRYFTPGSSIVPGQPIMDLVPGDDRLLVEAPIRPDEIGRVRVGQRINVRLTAYKQHRVPTLTGHVVYVSADRQANDKGEPFFMVRAELDPGALAPYPEVALEPGMPAEVLVIGGERRAIDYFISPITDSLNRSMREQ
jgi:HlyD family secretion protein